MTLEVAEARATDVLGTSGESVTPNVIPSEKRGGVVSVNVSDNI